jgi:hypothetical protein
MTADIGRWRGVLELVDWNGNERKVLSSTIALDLFSERARFGGLSFRALFWQLGVGSKGIPVCSECVLYYVWFSLRPSWLCYCIDHFSVSDEISDGLVLESTDRVSLRLDLLYIVLI